MITLRVIRFSCARKVNHGPDGPITLGAYSHCMRRNERGDQRYGYLGQHHAAPAHPYLDYRSDSRDDDLGRQASKGLTQ
jgi:hypothetical protein